MTDQPQRPRPPDCPVCRRPFSFSYEINRRDQHNNVTGTVWVCSAICLMRWSQHYVASKGVQAFNSAKGAVVSILEGFRGPR